MLRREEQKEFQCPRCRHEETKLIGVKAFFFLLLILGFFLTYFSLFNFFFRTFPFGN